MAAPALFRELTRGESFEQGRAEGLRLAEGIARQAGDNELGEVARTSQCQIESRDTDDSVDRDEFVEGCEQGFEDYYSGR